MLTWCNSYYIFGVGVSCRNLFSFVVYLYVSRSGSITSVGGGGRTGLVVRASDSGSGDPGSILGRVDVFFP